MRSKDPCWTAVTARQHRRSTLKASSALLSKSSFPALSLTRN